RQKEGGEQASASTPSEKATKGAGGSTTGSQSQQRSANESAYAEEPVQTTYTLTPDLFAGPTYELMMGSCSSLTELEYHLEEVYKATTDQLDWVNPEGQQYTVNRESARDVYSKRRIIAVTDLQIMEWHAYKHLDWISVRRDDDQIYKFKEGDF
nr:hypothetical protein [Tanacetum cinerariifolium]